MVGLGNLTWVSRVTGSPAERVGAPEAQGRASDDTRISYKDIRI